MAFSIVASEDFAGSLTALDGATLNNALGGSGTRVFTERTPGTANWQRDGSGKAEAYYNGSRKYLLVESITDADVRVSAYVPTVGGMGIMARKSLDSVLNCYLVFQYNSDLYLLSESGGSEVQLGLVSGVIADGDLMTLECIGTAIKVYLNGVLQISVTDSTRTSGTVGLYGSDGVSSYAYGLYIETDGGGGPPPSATIARGIRISL